MTVTITITLDEARRVSNALHNAISVMDQLRGVCYGAVHGESVWARASVEYENVVETLREWDDGLPGGDE